MNRSAECFLSVKGLCEYLQISYTKASLLAKDTCFPKIIIGGKKVFPKTQAIIWMEDHRYKNKSM